MRIKHSIYGLAVALLMGHLSAQDTNAPKLIPALGWDHETQGVFTTSVVADAQNNIWVGTEGKGVWCYGSRNKHWSQFTAKDGLGDDSIYALAVDKLGRVWVGHQNHGVSVWNGEKWKNYGLLDGPLGDRVFSIATCPTDGDVWIATDCGVARYSMQKDDWDYFTRASGLPSNQIQAIAFDSKGNIFLGTQCDGVVMAAAADNYKKWKTVTGPQMPAAAYGDGLPGNLINDIAVVKTDDKGGEMIMVATPNGLGTSSDGGEKWKYLRGQDWDANVHGLYPAANEEIVEAQDPEGQDGLLMEDWVTGIRQDEATKNVWFGYRKRGVEIRAVEKNKFLKEAGQDSFAYCVKGFCFPAKGPALVAVSDIDVGGLLTLDNAVVELTPGAEAPKTPTPLPASAKPLDAETLAALAKHLDVYKNKLKTGEAVFLGDDWRTQGDWIGRYGSSYVALCGLGADGVFEREEGYDVKIAIGPHNKGGEPETHTESKISNNIRMLYNPTLGYRSETEINDLSSHLPTYQAYWEGPDLWINTTVPAGLHCVSLYFTNNDAQANHHRNKFRDYDVQVLPWAEDKDAVQKSAPLARARVTDFFGGVYKQFIVAGPATYVIRVGRNHSFGTKLQGVFIDRLAGDFPNKKKQLPGFESIDFSPTGLTDNTAVVKNPVLSAANKLWTTLDDSLDRPGVNGLQLPLRILAYRAAVSEKAPAGLLEPWRWQIGIWTEDDRSLFDKTVAAAFKAYSIKHPPAPAPHEEEK